MWTDVILSMFAPIQHLFDFLTNTPLMGIVEKELFSNTKNLSGAIFWKLPAFFAALEVEDLFFEERKEEELLEL